MYSLVFVAVNRIHLFFVSSSAQIQQRTVRIQLTLCWLSILAAQQKSRLVATKFFVFSFFLFKLFLLNLWAITVYRFSLQRMDPVIRRLHLGEKDI